MNRETEMVKALYSGMVDREWNRLFQDEFHQLEWKTTWRFLERYLPEAGLVLDAGGGPGRYTIELARRGYDVVLLDLVAANLERAREEIAKAGVGARVKQVVEGTITDLSRFEDNSFDAVICLAPLSHVCPESDRLKAASEMVRVAKSEMCIFVSAISKYGALLATPEGWPQAVADPREDFPGFVEHGDNYAFMRDGYCHFFTSAELAQIIAGLNVRVLQMVGLEGFNTDKTTTNDFAANHPEAWKKWVEIHEDVCTDPFAVDASGHMMIVVRKTSPSAGGEALNRSAHEAKIDARELAGLLSDDKRLRVTAALALGASTPGDVRTVTGLSANIVEKSLRQLTNAGVVESDADNGYRLRTGVFRRAARGDHAPPAGSDGFDDLVRSGRLPRSRAERLAVLSKLAGLFEPGRRYPESDVNSRLRALNPDHAFLRRYLVDEGLLERANETDSGGRTVMVYWRAENRGRRSKGSEM